MLFQKALVPYKLGFTPLGQPFWPLDNLSKEMGLVESITFFFFLNPS